MTSLHIISFFSMTDHYQIESVKFISSQWERIKEQVSQQQMRTSTVTTTAKHGPIYYCDKRTFSTVSEHTVVIRDPWTVSPKSHFGESCSVHVFETSFIWFESFVSFLGSNDCFRGSLTGPWSPDNGGPSSWILGRYPTES